MISSMTAFGRSEQHYHWGSASWEIKSVNHRYLEPSFKLPEGLRHLEFPLRDQLKQHLSRGKIDCSLKVLQHSGQQTSLVINSDTVTALLAAARELGQQPGEWSTLNPLEVLAWPGVIEATDPYDTTVIASITEQFELTLKELGSTRRREGAELAGFISQRLLAIKNLLIEAREALPSILETQRLQLTRKLSEVIAQVDNQRLEQELVYTAQKADVEEELDRLDAHIKEVRRILEAGNTCGRRLDFLMQELHREANTLSSKSINSTTTLIAVELKVLIEQMREQIQNIE